MKPFTFAVSVTLPLYGKVFQIAQTLKALIAQIVNTFNKLQLFQLLVIVESKIKH